MSIRIEGLENMMAYIEREANKRSKDYLAILKRIGQKTVTAIRTGDASNWNDQTGNLRSSIGYIIVHDGNIVNRSGFKQVNGPKRNKFNVGGSKEGRSYAERLATQFPNGYVLIIVAGMDYAAYVENIEGKAVLAQGKLLAKRLHKELVDKYNARMEQRK